MQAFHKLLGAAVCGIAAFGLAMGGVAGAAVAADPGPFMGVYVGQAQVTLGGPDEGVEVRDLDVIIQPIDDGFRIDSVTVNHEGDRLSPDVRRRSASMSFVESDVDDVFMRDFELDMFSNTQDQNPLAGDPVQWARIEGDALLVYSFVIDDDGSYVLSTYRRTLTNGGMSLYFSYTVNGEIVREVEGDLIKVDNVVDDINP